MSTLLFPVLKEQALFNPFLLLFYFIFVMWKKQSVPADTPASSTEVVHKMQLYCICKGRKQVEFRNRIKIVFTPTWSSSPLPTVTATVQLLYVATAPPTGRSVNLPLCNGCCFFSPGEGSHEPWMFRSHCRPGNTAVSFIHKSKLHFIWHGSKALIQNYTWGNSVAYPHISCQIPSLYS